MSLAESPAVEAQYRQELERLLNSEMFRHAGSVSKLLEYLGHKSLAGDGSSLKEFTIGVDAFRKPPDYNPQSDPLVRVLASKLRHRLDEYYRTEGSGALVRIELPKGHYQLHFQPREGILEGPSSATQNCEVRKWRRISCGLMLALVAVAILAFRRDSAAAADSSSAPAFSENAELNLLWQAYLERNRPNLIVFGTPLFAHLSGTFFRDTQLNQWNDANHSDQVRRVQEVLRSPFAHPSYNFTGIGEAHGILLVSRVLAGAKSDLMLRRSSAISWDDIGANNVIFLGPPKYNLHLKDLPLEQAFTIEKGSVINVKPLPGEKHQFQATRTESHSAILEDYALISRFPGLHNHGSISILASSSTEGTWAAAEYATSPRHAKELVARLRDPSGRLPDAFQVLVRAKFKDQVPIAISYVTHRVLKAGPAGAPHN
jgi:hypothetical protein